jgi:integrase
VKYMLCRAPQLGGGDWQLRILLKGNGEDVKTVQESLRHSTVRMTMETYTQAIPAHVRQAQQRVSGQLLATAGNVQEPVVVM